MIKQGLIGISNDTNGLFPALVRFFTNSKYSHSFLTFGSLYGKDSVIEASQLVQVVSFDTHYKNNQNGTYVLYEPTQAENRDQALSVCFYEYAGLQYGYLQLIWFVYRWFMKSFLRKDVSREKNWMTDGVICSELVYQYLYQLGSPYRELLSGYWADTIQAQDILDIMEANPHLFKKVEGN